MDMTVIWTYARQKQIWRHYRTRYKPDTVLLFFQCQRLFLCCCTECSRGHKRRPPANKTCTTNSAEQTLCHVCWGFLLSDKERGKVDERSSWLFTALYHCGAHHSNKLSITPQPRRIPGLLSQLLNICVQAESESLKLIKPWALCGCAGSEREPLQDHRCVSGVFYFLFWRVLTARGQPLPKDVATGSFISEI